MFIFGVCIFLFLVLANNNFGVSTTAQYILSQIAIQPLHDLFIKVVRQFKLQESRNSFSGGRLSLSN